MLSSQLLDTIIPYWSVRKSVNKVFNRLFSIVTKLCSVLVKVILPVRQVPLWIVKNWDVYFISCLLLVASKVYISYTECVGEITVLDWETLLAPALTRAFYHRIRNRDPLRTSGKKLIGLCLWIKLHVESFVVFDENGDQFLECLKAPTSTLNRTDYPRTYNTRSSESWLFYLWFLSALQKTHRWFLWLNLC